jgi:hypothetical protein
MPTAIPPGMLEYYLIDLSTNGLLLQARQQVPLRQPFLDRTPNIIVGSSVR